MEKETIFFSYARADSQFALDLARELRNRGARLWMDQLDIKPGSRWDVSIETALRNSGTLLVIMTPDSVSSNNVMDEVSYALEEGKQILPVLYKVCDRPLRLRRLQFADFTKDFQKGIESLTITLDIEKDKPAISSDEVLKTYEEEKDVSITKPKGNEISKEYRKVAMESSDPEDTKSQDVEKIIEQAINGGTTEVIIKKSYGRLFLYLIFISVALISGVWGIYKIIKNDSGNAASPVNEFMETKTGLKYIFHYRSNNTVSPREGDYLDLIMVSGTEDTILFDSRNLPEAQQFNLPMIASVFQGDLYEGFSMMHIGDSATFRLVADSVWTKMYKMENAPPEMEMVKYLDFHIKLNDVMSDNEMDHRQAEDLIEAEKEEVTKRRAFISENYPGASRTESGLYFKLLKRVRNGRKPEIGEVVQVHYTGKLLDGTNFDSSYDRGTPYKFPLGKDRVIKGWDEGIAMLRVGEKAVLIIPSDLAYGSRGSGNKIPPFSTLVFEIELIEIVD